MKTDGSLKMVPPCKAGSSQKTSAASEQQQQQQQQQQHEDLEPFDESQVFASKKRRVQAGDGQSVAAAAAAVEEAPNSCSEGPPEGISGPDEAESGKIQGWAPPGLGVCQLWAQQASSLKRKNGTSDSVSPFSYSESSSLPASSERRHPGAAAAVGFGIDDAVPATREDKAKLVGGYLGTSRPGYGDASRTPVWWPAEVPWLKGVSISQMNNATLNTLVLAVKTHQREERRQALISGEELPDGLFAFTPKTKKEMSRLIRSIQGRRLEYGKEGKRPVWWPKNCPWDNHKPLSTMKHGEVTSIFKAMVREGLLTDADVNGNRASCTTSPSPPSGTGKNDGNDNDRVLDSQGEDSGEATSDNGFRGGGGSVGESGHHQSASDSSSERSSFWDGDDDSEAGRVMAEISSLCQSIDSDSAAEDLPPLPAPRDTCGLLPSSDKQQHPHQYHLPLQQQQQQPYLQRPLEFDDGGLGLNIPPLAPTAATCPCPGWAQPPSPSPPLGKLFSSHANSGSFLAAASQVEKCSASTGPPSLPEMESVSCSPTEPLQTAASKADEESAWQGRALFEELLFGGMNGPQSFRFHGEEGGGATERMFGFNPLDDDLVFAAGGGQVKLPQ